MCFDWPPHDFVVGSVKEVRHKSPVDVEVLERKIKLR